MKHWNGKDLEGEWIATIKLDGVQVIVKDKVATSRAGKPLYNIPKNLKSGTYEYYHLDWATSISDVRTHNGKTLKRANFYNIDTPDATYLKRVSRANDINDTFNRALEDGMEGLVLYGPDNQRLKVKPTTTHDLKVTAIVPGKGKHLGRMGALLTSKGKVGTGFTDVERGEAWYIGETIEVEAMGLTPNGKLRHPRFIRRRFDK